MLAITDAFVGGVLTFTGDGADDSLTLFSQNAAGTSLVYDIGGGAVLRNGVTQVRFFANGGDNALTVIGTNGNESFNIQGTNLVYGAVPFLTTDVASLSLNTGDGADTVVASNLSGTLVVDGGGGSNILTLAVADGIDDQLTLAPGSAAVSDAGRSANFAQFTSITTLSEAGDQATFVDSAGDDIFQSISGVATLFAGGSTLQVQQAGTVNVNFTTGNDISLLYDSPGADDFQFDAVNLIASITGGGFSTTVVNADAVYAFAFGNGGDTSTFYGTPGDDVFYGLSTYSLMYGTGYLVQAIDFDNIAATDSAGFDIAVLIGDTGSDTLIASPTVASLSGPVPSQADRPVSNVVNGFDQVFSFLSNEDSVQFTGSGGDDTLVAYESLATLMGSGYLNQAFNAGSYQVDALAGGMDMATIFGSAGDDTLTLSGSTATLDYSTGVQLVATNFESVAAAGAGGNDVLLQNDPQFVFFNLGGFQLVALAATEVSQLLDRAAAASASSDAIIAIVDRMGRILGVRVESGVVTSDMIFAIDGAVAKARTGAFFSSNEGPLTSRTVRFISQSTMTQREVESNPNIADVNSLVRGPGFVAPIGVGGHFPPEIPHTPPVDLFAIEHTNRDGIVHPGEDGIRGTADMGEGLLPGRFNATYIPGQEIEAPESYGYVTNMNPNAQARGIATLPGGIPLYKTINGVPQLVGGIGVFFPGPDGYASFEQGFDPNNPNQTEFQRTNAPRVLEAEWIAFAAAGGAPGKGFAVGTLGGVAPLAGFGLPGGPQDRIDLVGITLESVGSPAGNLGLQQIVTIGQQVGQGNAADGANQVVNGAAATSLNGRIVPEGWLVGPQDSPVPGGLTAVEVATIINQGILEAQATRAAIRLPLGNRTKMMFSVTDTMGNVLGIFRMPDATYFSIDVAVAKARNAKYYADPAALGANMGDRVDAPDGIPDVNGIDTRGDGNPDLPLGVAFTARTFRFLAEPRFPSGVDGISGPFSIFSDPGIDPRTAKNLGAPLAASVYAGPDSSVVGFDAFTPGRNFRDTSTPIQNQNGIIFFPGSTALYRNGVLVGGFGISGDGVDQDDVVTVAGQAGFAAPAALRADQDAYLVAGVRLPYQKFNRNPRG